MDVGSESGPAAKTIVLVDDNHVYLYGAGMLLRREGYEVVGFLDPYRALRYLRERRVDLVLVDFFMTQMTGVEFARELRGFAPEAEVIVQTGFASKGPTRLALLDLGLRYLDKRDGVEGLLRSVAS